MKATAQLVDFLKAGEGFKQFSSPCPSGDVYTDGPFEGVLVHDIGYGCRYWEDGKEVFPDEEINSYEAELLMVHRIENEFEPAVSRLFPERQFSPGEWDAMVSLLYNFGEAKVRRYPLRTAINAGKSGEDLARQWVKYCNPDRPDLRKGLYRRRVAEMLMWFGLPYKRGLTCAYREDVWDIINEVRREMGIPEVPKAASVTPTPEPVLILDKPLPMEAKVPRQMTLPDEWDKMTEKQQVAWLNTGEFIALGGKVGEPIKPAPLPEAAKPKVAVKPSKAPRPVEHVEYLDDQAKANIKVKKLEDAQRGKAFAKKEIGKAIGVTAVGGMVAENIGALEPAIQFVSKYSYSTIGVVFMGMTGFAVVYYFFGKWQEQKGRDEADTLLE